MGVFEDVIVKAKETAEAAGRKTGELFELSRLKVNGAEVSRQIDQQMQVLGKIAYGALKKGEKVDLSAREIIAKIDQLKEKLENIESRIAALKSIVYCSHCKQGNAKDAAYCSKCGAKLTKDDADAEGPVSLHYMDANEDDSTADSQNCNTGKDEPPLGV